MRAPQREWICVRIGMQIGKRRPPLRVASFTAIARAPEHHIYTIGRMDAFFFSLLTAAVCAIAGRCSRRARGINFHLNAAE